MNLNNELAILRGGEVPRLQRVLLVQSNRPQKTAFIRFLVWGNLMRRLRVVLSCYEVIYSKPGAERTRTYSAPSVYVGLVRWDTNNSSAEAVGGSLSMGWDGSLRSLTVEPIRALT